MIFKLHYFFLTAGANALGILLGVYVAAYTDASSTEIGLLYMMMPFIGLTSRPLICSWADREQAHRKYIMTCQLVTAVSYVPFVIIPFLGPAFYEEHPRVSWYLLLFFKILGDIAFGGVVSIGDSLAINYSKRIKTDFCVYRVWGTVSWMIFGTIIGQINEIWFLPKYVPAFLVLIFSSLLSMLSMYMWPREYFVMVTPSEIAKEHEQKEKEAAAVCGGGGSGGGGGGKLSAMTKSLMPKEVVWAHAKRQLRALATCSCLSTPDEEPEANGTTGTANQLTGTASANKKPTGVASARDQAASAKANSINRSVQLQILWLLLKRDPRIVGYIAMFIMAGFSVVPISFFFISLSDICHTNDRCDFSQLGGFLQVSMAIAETILFIYIRRVIDTLGRVNTISISFALTSLKYTFYGTIWPEVNPYFSLLSEIPHGIIFGIYLTLMVEMGHLFSSEVEFVIPELLERGVVKADDEATRERLKLSLAATMQALITSANDGLGRGFGALIYGLIIDSYSYHTLWLVIAGGGAAVFVVVQTVNIIGHCFRLEFGLDVAAAKRTKDKGHQGDGNFYESELGLDKSGPMMSGNLAMALAETGSIHSHHSIEPMQLPLSKQNSLAGSVAAPEAGPRNG